MEQFNLEDFKNKFPNEKRKLNQLLMNEFLADAILRNEKTGKEFCLHKAVLASSSNFFYYNFKEKEEYSNTKSDKVVLSFPIKNVTALSSKADDDCSISIVLKFIYNNQKFDKIKSEVSEINIFNLLSISHCLALPKLTKYLTQMVKEEILNYNIAVRILFEGLYFENEVLIEESIQIIQKEFHNVTKNLEEFTAILDLPFDMFLKLIRENNLNAESEKQICDLVFNYIKVRQNLTAEKTEFENVQPLNLILQNNKKEETEFQSQQESSSNKDKEQGNFPKEIEETDSHIAQDSKTLPIDQNIKTEINISPLINIDTNSTYNYLWGKHIENLNSKLKKQSLSKEEIRRLIECIRFSFLTHTDLLSLSTEPLMSDHKDLILEGLSLRLNSYENSNSLSAMTINTTPRNYKSISKQETLQRFSHKSEHKEKSINLNLEDDLVNTGVKTREFANFNISNNNNYRTPNKVNIPSMNFSLNNPRPPQDTKVLMSTLSKSQTKKKDFEFNYEFDFDENGVFFFLGTLGKTSEFQNPHNLAQVKVFSSSLGQGKLSDLVGRSLVNLRTLNEPSSYFGVDLGPERFLIPTCYSIKNRNSSSHVMVCWTLEGSNDRINYDTLDTRIFSSTDEFLNKNLEKERTQLRAPGGTSTWGIGAAIKEKFPNGFRFFVLRQIGPNSSGGFNLALSGLELYGKGLGRWAFN